MKKYTKTEVAYHEAGHAVCIYTLYTDSLVSVSIGKGTGLTKWRLKGNKPANVVSVLLAGHIAHSYYKGENAKEGSMLDDTDAVKFALKACKGNKAKMRKLVAFCHEQATQWVFTFWSQIEDVAKRLIRKGRLTGKEVGTIFEKSIQKKGTEFPDYVEYKTIMAKLPR
jgi:hypothetical protein